MKLSIHSNWCAQYDVVSTYSKGIVFQELYSRAEHHCHCWVNSGIVDLSKLFVNGNSVEEGMAQKHVLNFIPDLFLPYIPLFRIPCRSGMCSTPIHVTSSQLIANDIFPVPVVKAILFPGAITNGLTKNLTIPSWDNLLNIYNLTGIKESSALPDLQRLEVLAGSYFCVAGALVGILKPGRMSMFGTLLVIWGLVKEGILGKPANTDPTKAIYVYPTMLLALICALSSIKYDVKKVMRTPPARPIAKPLQSSSKSKLK